MIRGAAHYAQNVRFTISVEAERTLEALQLGDEANFELAQQDLMIIEQEGIESLQIDFIFGQWVGATGPTGRVSYLISPNDHDAWLVESIDFH
jgi:hypothetical protein